MKVDSSIGSKKNDAGSIAEEFKGMTLEAFKELARREFYSTYGKYENASGKMFIELEHDGDAEDHTKGSVKWRKGLRGQDELLEDLTLTRDEAIPRYFELIEKGYSRTFKAITAEDFAKENEAQRLAQGEMMREGLLGVYYKGKAFFRVNEYEKGEFSIERGYDGQIIEGQHECEEWQAKMELDKALMEGYRKEGEEEVEDAVFSFDAFDIEIQGNEFAEERKATPKEGEFNFGAFSEMFDD